MDQIDRRKYEIELARLDSELRELDEHWRRIPMFGTFGLCALPIGYLLGVAAALVALMVTAALVGTSAYLTGVRKNENRWTHQSLLRELSGR